MLCYGKSRTSCYENKDKSISIRYKDTLTGETKEDIVDMLVLSTAIKPNEGNKKLGKILYKKRFSVFSGGRKPGQENEKNHFRKGIAGDWINHFNEDHKKYFKEKYNHLLIPQIPPRVQSKHGGGNDSYKCLSERE